VESRAGHERLKARRRELTNERKKNPRRPGVGQTQLLRRAGQREERSRGEARVYDVWDCVDWPRVSVAVVGVSWVHGREGGRGSREGVMPTWLDA